jgi:hypothetical protein
MVDEGAVEAARGLAEGDQLVVVRAGRRTAYPGPGRAGSPIGWPGRIPVTVQAAADEGLDVVVDVVPMRRRGGLAVEAPPGTAEPLPLVARIPYDRIRKLKSGGDGSDGPALLEVAYGRLAGPFTAWRAGGTPVRGFLRRGPWNRWPDHLRRSWRRRREWWTAYLTVGPFDERVATGLVRYLKDPTRETEIELDVGVSSLLGEVLDEALGDAAPQVMMVSNTSIEITSPRSVRLVGYAVIPVEGTEGNRLRPFLADLARPPATSTLSLAREEDELDEPPHPWVPPAVVPDAVAWAYTFQVRLRETWVTRVLPALAPPEDQAPRGERLAAALAAYLERPSRDLANEIAEHLYWLWWEDHECWIVQFGPDLPTLDGPFEADAVEILSRTAIRLTAEEMVLDEDGDWYATVVAELALPPAMSTWQIGTDPRHVATFVLPPPPD